MEWPASHKQEVKKEGPGGDWGITRSYYFFPVAKSVLSIVLIVSVVIVMCISRYAEHPEYRQHDAHREPKQTNGRDDMTCLMLCRCV